MGTPDYLISAACTLVLAQRLARKTCEECRIPDEDVTPEVLTQLGISSEQASRAKVFKGKGCNKCKDSGYKGRMGIYEILNVTKPVKEAILAKATTPEIKAIAFVGSSNVAKTVYSRSTSKGKRALCLGGAKNHMIVVPDADQDSTAKGLLASSMGSAGQRCMAASVALGVANVDSIIDQLVDEAKKLKLGVDMGTIINASSLDKNSSLISERVFEDVSQPIKGFKPLFSV